MNSIVPQDSVVIRKKKIEYFNISDYYYRVNLKSENELMDDEKKK